MTNNDVINLISKFESDKSDIEILKELELCEKELKDIYKHVEWWQQDSTIYDDISELHGPKLKKFQGYYNQKPKRQ